MTRGLAFALLLSLLATSARAQEPGAAGSTLTPTQFRDLPSSNNLFQLLETVSGETISDRFYGGGLNTGRNALAGAFLSSGQQTQFFVGDVNVTMPNGGTPFFFPTLLFWSRADVTAAMMPVDQNAPGLAISMDPARPGSTWTSMAEASGAGGGMIGTSSTSVAPPIEKLRNASHAGLLFSGPLSPRVGLATAIDWTSASQVERTGTSQPDGQAASVFTNLVFRQNDRNELRLVGWLQRTQAPSLEATLIGTPIADQTMFGHVQATWERQESTGGSARLFAAYSQAGASTDRPLPASFSLERLLVGPVPTVVDSGDQTSRQWTAGVRWQSMPRRNAHAFELGAVVTGATTRSGPGYSGSITELIDGNAARVWQYSTPGIESHRHATFVNAFAGDRIGLGIGRSFDVHIAYDGAFGSADGATTGVSWSNVLPRALLRWKQGADSHFTWIAGYRRSADRLTLDTLAVGDPAAPTANVFVPSSIPGRLPPIVMRVGPGTGGNANFSAIDPGLARPTQDEISVGIEAQLTKNVRGRITAIAKEQRHLFDLVDVGVPLSSYSQFTVTDGRPAADGGDVQLPVYSRLPPAFAADRYLLTTNVADDTARGAAVVLNSEANLRRLTLIFNASASITDGQAENRGFRVDENNLGPLGEVLTNPNATNDARGRLFYDRAFTLKLSGVYHFGAGVTLGVIARYQDGQPFSRLTAVPGATTAQQPNQGIELIRAYEAGGARFMYTGTLDVRLQKRMTFGRTAVDLFVDAYNLPNMGNEVEERVLTGPGFRDITAIQPPVSVHVGARINF